MSFSGFSEDDIRQLSSTNATSRPAKSKETATLTSKSEVKRATLKPQNKTQKGSHLPEISNKSLGIQENGTILSDLLPKEARLSSIPEASDPIPAPEGNVLKTVHVPQVISKIKSEAKPEKLNLDEFEARQKLIEEQNKKRKELLVKALADRTKRTQEEAQRLNEIQDEFKKLDAVLSTDVKILRKQIEIATIDYTECEKKYQKIEKEFLEAKLTLHQKREKKELLTEHLCAIIEKNEERKAEKLMALIQKLESKPNEVVNNGCGDIKDVKLGIPK